MGMLIKLLKWVPLNIVSVFGILQAVIKLAKEIITAVVNFLVAVVVVLPNVDLKKANAVALSIRSWIEGVDAFVGKWKDKVLSWVHTK